LIESVAIESGDDRARRRSMYLTKAAIDGG
jgi:hypothetical protein